MRSGKVQPLNPLPLIIMFFIIFLISVFIGYLYYNNQKKNILDAGKQELSGITDLKVKQLSQWRKERISDGLLLSKNLPVVRALKKFISGRNDKILRNDLLDLFRKLTEETDYKDVLLVDSRFNVRLFYPNQDTVIGNFLLPKLPDLMKKGQVLLTDLHFTGKVSFVHLDLVIPFRNPDPADSSVFGLLIMRVDPGNVMFPLIKSWPVNSKTSESFIFNRQGDSIVYLSELKHVADAPLSFRKPASDEKLAASMALRGIHETVNAIDYRGVPVVAAMKQVPESSWYMLAKTDRSEILAKLNDQLHFVAIIIILINIITLFLCVALWWQRRVGFYKQKFENEQERLALVKHYDYILKYANDIIFLLDDDFTIIEANDKAIETYGYSRSEIIGINLKNLLAEKSLKNYFATNIALLHEKGFAVFEAVHRKKDGEEFPVEVSSRKVEIEGVTYYQSIMRDITERKLAEESLKQSEEKFRKVFEDSPIGMATTHKDMSILRANKAFCEMLGYSEKRLEGMTFRDFTHPDYIADNEVSLLRLISREIPIYHTEKRYVRHDQRIIWGSTTVSLIRNNNGEVNFILVMVEDITARKISEAALERSLSLQHATIESTADGILVVDNNGKIVLYNQRFAEMWLIPREIMKLMHDESALNYVLDQLISPEDFISKVRELYSDPEAVSTDFLRFRDGRIFERYSMPQKVGGKSIGRVWSFRDITMQKKTEAELIASREKAVEGDRLKTAFLHNISHEIRTPMNAILGFSALLNEPDTDVAERKQYTDIIFQSGSQLLSIINDIVDLASIESGQVKINASEINLNKTLQILMDQFSYRQIPGKIELSLITPLPDEKTNIVTDSTKLVQIISNLINNSFKFTSQGKIEFGYQKSDGFFEIYVSDTGIGIPADHLLKIFDRFYQVDSAVSRQFTGAGIGLSISKAYVELLGGSIHVKSEPEKGTEFRFTIPFKLSW